jgi:hypothetical protein
MPAEWYERMNTIKTYEEDANLQLDASSPGRSGDQHRQRPHSPAVASRPGKDQSVFFRYAPNPNDCRDVHSIYFEVLGEHGWIGLTLFLTLLAMTWLKCGSIIRMAKKSPTAPGRATWPP